MLAGLVGLCCAAAPAVAHAEIVRGGKHVAGPLDLAVAKVGQHERRLRARIETTGPLPRLQALDAHPSMSERRAERFLCLNLASPAIGRRLLCPAGPIHHGRVEVGISVVGRRGTRARGAVPAVVERGKRHVELAFGLRALGLKPGRLTFSAQSSWYGPGCGAEAEGTACRDRVPGQGSGSTGIYPVRRVGCHGFSDYDVLSGPGDRKEVALTFDDGPSVYTPQILRILEHHHARATFFEIGSQVHAYSAYSNRILAEGSELGNHTMNHEVGAGKANLAATNRIIEHETGFRPCMFRPPEGVLPGSTQAAAEALHMVSVRWDVETSDYTLPGSGTIYSRAIRVSAGSIVLMHDGGGPRNQTVDALPRIIENLKSRGYRLVTLTELLGGHYELAEVHRDPRALRPVSLETLLAPPVIRAGP